MHDLLDAAEPKEADPDSVGFVPPVTFGQVQGYYKDVQRWLAHASRAAHDPTFDLPPRDLPATQLDWSPVGSCPRPHLDAMIAAVKAMQLHAEAAKHGLEQSTPQNDEVKLAWLCGVFAEAVSKSNYAANMHTPNASAALHEQIEELAKDAVEQVYRAGQYVSYPDLLLRTRPTTPSGSPGSLQRGQTPLPGQAGFDPWVMTDPTSPP